MLNGNILQWLLHHLSLLGLRGTTLIALNLQEAAAVAARGKRGKKKKVLTKYAHQDEEDRQLAMQLLASTGEAALHELC